jgi:hypothetical protein
MTSTDVEIDLEGGGEARIVSSDGDHVTLESSRPYPPGAPLAGVARDLSGQYRVKVRGSRKTADERYPFVVEGRFVNLTRDQRAAVLSRFPATATGSGTHRRER